MTEPTPRTEAGRRMLRDPMYRHAIGHILAIEAQARTAEHELLELQGKAYEAELAQARTEALDVEALAGALGRVNDMATHAFLSDAEAIAREYQRILAAKETP